MRNWLTYCTQRFLIPCSHTTFAFPYVYHYYFSFILYFPTKKDTCLVYGMYFVKATLRSAETSTNDHHVSSFGHVARTQAAFMRRVEK